MDEIGASVCTPTLREQDQDMAMRPWIEEEEFNAGYLKRSMHLLPKQGSSEEWSFCRDYYIEKDTLPALNLDEDVLVYEPSISDKRQAG